MELIKDDYKVQLEVFEGPLDLLLYLIKKDEVDIYDIPIGRITDQYMEYLKLMKVLDLNIAGDFIVMSATLMLIKSRMLLPVEERKDEAEEEEEDPRWDLVRQLVEYKKFKDAADHLEDLELHMENVFGRESEYVELGDAPDVDLKDASIFDLISALNEALGRVQEENLQEIFAEEYTVSQKVSFIVENLKVIDRLCVSDLFGGMKSRQEIVCTFLAVLELIKLNKIACVQDDHFSDIVVEAREPDPPPVLPPEEPEEPHPEFDLDDEMKETGGEPDEDGFGDEDEFDDEEDETL
ncbi:segregation and condensation protein A [Pontiella agarivorans]|uniref:Segregation and condensation protein A n=1 Tax=Pontiella agarivorans TaxID=3038953 RepID=A0ABU5MXV1_9BACT|nr:segregation/condensation protein A [Pontiella agarivorans]MDZ8119028.1 segregation/condensation protein A [Pontiella agarivorans]